MPNRVDDVQTHHNDRDGISFEESADLHGTDVEGQPKRQLEKMPPSD